MAQATIEPRPEFADILKQEELFPTEGTDRQSDRINGWFNQLIVQSGVDLAPSLFVLLCLCSAVTFAGLVFVVLENLLTTAVAALLGLAFPVGLLMLVRNRRQMTMLNQMPGMVGELARAARTGRSLEQCLETVAHDTPRPLGKELRSCVRRMQLGISLPNAMKEIPDRTGLFSLHVLVAALAVHHQTGGDLVAVLERLARTIRDRLTFLGRVRAATTASRATATLMIVIPPLVLLFFMIRDPNYFTDLMSSNWGQRAMLLAAALQIVGSIWIVRILRSSQRT